MTFMFARADVLQELDSKNDRSTVHDFGRYSVSDCVGFLAEHHGSWFDHHWSAAHRVCSAWKVEKTEIDTLLMQTIGC